jgi:hypothetical protein
VSRRLDITSRDCPKYPAFFGQTDFTQDPLDESKSTLLYQDGRRKTKNSNRHPHNAGVIRQYKYDRTRYGFGGSLDYKINDASLIYIGQTREASFQSGAERGGESIRVWRTSHLDSSCRGETF